MHRRDLPGAVSEGIIDSYFFDLKKKILSMRVGVLDGGARSSYALEFVKIHRLQFETESVQEWDLLELTELWIDESPDRSPDRTWAITLNFWDRAQMIFRCDEIMVDGEPLQ